MDLIFSLITEGITDQPTLEAILKGHYRRFEDVDVDVRIVQPLRDATDSSKQENDGGWERVFEACSDPDVALDALSLSDYLIVQIDTDQGEHVNYGLPLAPNGIDVDEPTLAAQARQIIAAKFGDRWPDIQERVFTAVSVHSLECWLLALHAPANPCATKSCENRLQRMLQAERTSFRKDYACYDELSKDFRKTRELDRACTRSASLNQFVQSLPAA